MFGKAKPPLAQAAVSRPLLEVPVLAKLANASLKLGQMLGTDS
jgi:hypothetical protein